jgi:hypothetical protein
MKQSCGELVSLEAERCFIADTFHEITIHKLSHFTKLYRFYIILVTEHMCVTLTVLNIFEISYEYIYPPCVDMICTHVYPYVHSTQHPRSAEIIYVTKYMKLAA